MSMNIWLFILKSLLFLLYSYWSYRLDPSNPQKVNRQYWSQSKLKSTWYYYFRSVVTVSLHVELFEVFCWIFLWTITTLFEFKSATGRGLRESSYCERVVKEPTKMKIDRATLILLPRVMLKVTSTCKMLKALFISLWLKMVC